MVTQMKKDRLKRPARASLRDINRISGAGWGRCSERVLPSLVPSFFATLQPNYFPSLSRENFLHRNTSKNSSNRHSLLTLDLTMPDMPPVWFAKGPRGPLRHRCEEPDCQKQGDDQFLLCNGCYLVRYCSPQHQFSDHSRHKSLCDQAKRLHDAMFLEEEKRTGNPNFPQWFAQEEQYKIVSTSFASLLCRVDTLDTIQKALTHRLYMESQLFPWWAIDDDCHRNKLSLLLRLDNDQQCYEVATMPWDHEVASEFPTDMFAAIPASNFDSVYDEDIAALLLLKLKLLVDVRNIKVARKVLPATLLPPELWDSVERATIRSMESQRLFNKSFKELIFIERNLVNDVRKLGRALMLQIAKTSPDRVNSRCRLTSLLEKFSEICWETEGILELLQCACACAAQDFNGLVGWRSTYGYRKAMSSDVLVGFCFADLWNYLDWAVMDYAYLGKRDWRHEDRAWEYRRRVKKVEECELAEEKGKGMEEKSAEEAVVRVPEPLYAWWRYNQSVYLDGNEDSIGGEHED